MQIIPTLLTSNPQEARQKLQRISQIPKLSWVQADIIDGVFANNQTLTPQDWRPLISQFPHLKFEAHLMVRHPTDWIADCLQIGFSRLTAHIEMMPDQRKFTKKFLNLSTSSPSLTPQLGLALNLPTPIEKLNSPIFSHLSTILLMSVPAGFGGQKFNSSVLKKIKKLNRLRQKQNSNFLIAIDGGLSPQNIQEIRKAGANIACIGSSLLQGNLHQNLHHFTQSP